MNKRIFLLIWLVPAASRAWGMVGHQTVALIAEDHLTPAARMAVRKLLGPDQDLESVSTWADSIIKTRPETAPWHYLNLDARQPENEFDLSYSCKDHNCVVDQIEKDLEMLREPFADRREKKEALMFLVHFVGDLHQPLHCVDDHDRGGNQKWFRYHGRHGTARHYKWVELHGLWDNLLQPKAKQNPRRLASLLEKEITPQEEADWAKGKAADWAFESFLVAQKDIYAGLPEGPLIQKNRWGKDLPEDYYSGKMIQVVDRQLEKAGIRLAYLLNGVFENKK